MKKRVLAMALTLCMVIGLLPTTVLAAEGTNYSEDHFEYVAPDGVKYEWGYFTLNQVPGVNHMMVVGYEGEPTDITIPAIVRGTYINAAGEEVSFSKAVDGINHRVFADCDSLETVRIEGSPVMSGVVFTDCSSLREIDLSGSSIKNIDTAFFANNCDSLTTVTMPPTLEKMNGSAFSASRNIEDVYFLNPTAPTITVTSGSLHDAFENAAVFHVPTGARGYEYSDQGHYKHAVVYGKDTVTYGVDYELMWQTSDELDFGTGYKDGKVSKTKFGFVVKNTGADTISFEVQSSNTKFTCDVPRAHRTGSYGVNYLYPGETSEIAYIELNGNANSDVGELDETITLTIKGSYTQETKTETFRVHYNVLDEFGVTVTPSTINFGDISVNALQSEFPTRTVTVTNDRAETVYLRVNSANGGSADNFNATGLKTDSRYPGHVVLEPGKSVTFDLALTPFALKTNFHNGTWDLGITVYRQLTVSGSQVIGGTVFDMDKNPRVTVKANPITGEQPPVGPVTGPNNDPQVGDIAISPSVLDFGTVSLGYGSVPAKSFTFTNVSSGELKIYVTCMNDDGDIIIGGVYRLNGSDGSGFEATVKPGESVQMTVQPIDGIQYEDNFDRHIAVWVTKDQNRVKLASADVKFSVKGGGLELSTDEVAFGEVQEGYTQPGTKTVTVKNTGTSSVTLTQPTSTNYEVGKLSTTSLRAGKSATFTVRPKAGLKPGDYSELLSITGKDVSAGVNLSFTVQQAAPGTKPADWAKADVEKAIELGILPQELQSAYDQPITRQEFCLLADELYRAVIGNYPITSAQPFEDTDNFHVLGMAAMGVVQGIGGNKFDPNGQLTREQAATILARLAKAALHPLDNGEVTFSDKEQISGWALEAVGQMQLSGIMKGTSDTTFSPLMTYTREQSIVTIMRLYGMMK